MFWSFNVKTKHFPTEIFSDMLKHPPKVAFEIDTKVLTLGLECRSNGFLYVKKNENVFPIYFLNQHAILAVSTQNLEVLFDDNLYYKKHINQIC